MLQLTDKTLKCFTPPDFRPDPFVPASNSIGILGQYFEHFAGSTARAVEFSKGRAGKTAGYRMWGLILDFEQIESVEQDTERSWKTEASNRLNGIAKGIRTVQDRRIPIYPPKVDSKVLSNKSCWLISSTPVLPSSSNIETFPVHTVSTEKLLDRAIV